MALENPPEVRDRGLDELELNFFLGAAAHAFEFKLGLLGARLQEASGVWFLIEIVFVIVVCQYPAA